jgi:hypothetical protein
MSNVDAVPADQIPAKHRADLVRNALQFQTGSEGAKVWPHFWTSMVRASASLVARI